MPQFSNYGRVVTLAAVAQGNVFYARAGDTTWTQATNNSGGTPPLNFTGIVLSSSLGDNLYFADGVNAVYFDSRNGTVEDWTLTDGDFPADSANNFPTIIETWRGRILQAGILLAPQQLHASRIDDPFDHDYNPVNFDAGQAWALTVGEQGEVGDIITGLVPYTDDVLIIGGDHTVQMLTGDITDGGKKILLSDQMGMAFGRAWCRDPYGSVYFMSSKAGIFRLTPGQASPIPISQPIEQLVTAINTGTNGVRLGYDDRYQLIRVFITPLAEPGETTHYVFEIRTGAWWQVKHGHIKHDPLTCCTFDGNLPDDRVLLIGSWDGYVRYYSPDAEDDDGYELTSRGVFGPVLTPTNDEMMLRELQPVMGAASEEVEYAVHAADTAEEAAALLDDDDAVPVEGVLEAGRNTTQPIRAAGKAIYIAFESTKRWAMESIRMLISSQGKVRGRGR